jgi:hypothetical protein
MTHRKRGRALGENYAHLTASSTLVVSKFGPFVIATFSESTVAARDRGFSGGERVHVIT